jgi:hypothetical protein
VRKFTKDIWQIIEQGYHRGVSLKAGDLSQQFASDRFLEGELSEVEELLLRVPKRGQVNSPGELDDRQVGRLAPFHDCLDQPR